MKKIVSIFLLCFVSLAIAAPLKNMVVFGDSLSDNGNLYEYLNKQVPLSPPYYDGRFTNGEVWVERLAHHYFGDDTSSRLLDYAFGGAGVSEDPDDDGLFTLRSEIQSYLVAHGDKADSESLFVVWIGANNYLAVPDDKEAAVKEVVDGISKGLARLADNGAKHIVVLNLPDLGRTPAGALFDAKEQLTALAILHNQALGDSVQQLKVQYPDVEWALVDVNTKFTDMLNHPGQYGFTNITDTCYDALTSAPSEMSMVQMASHVKHRFAAKNCEGYFFFDPVHPTEGVHEVMANTAYERFEDLGISFK